MINAELKAARERLNLTQQQVAEFLKTPLCTVQGWETRYKTPPAALVALQMLEKMDEKNRNFWLNNSKT